MSSILKKISFTVLANIFSAFTVIIMVLVLPKLMTLEDYGVWQLFMFYFSYVGFLHFGWLDGIYLRYGGIDYEDLDRFVFSGQFFLLSIFFISECILINIFLSLNFIKEYFLEFVIRIVSIASIFANMLTFVNFTFQITDRIKEYARNVILERSIKIILLLLCVAFNAVNHKDIIFITVASNFIVACYGLYIVRDLVFSKRANLILNINEAWENISVGSKLLLSNIAGMLILGVMRFGISRGWDIITFGKVSLSLSVSNFLMIFISAVSVVLFPILKKTNSERLVELYVVLRRLLSGLLLALLVTYYPLKTFLSYWLPKYNESLFFMGLLLPVCIFESKMQMLVSTYLKSLRQEMVMLKINMVSILFACITTWVTVEYYSNLTVAILAIVVNFSFRLFLAEYYVENILRLQLLKERISEFVLVISFIGINLMNLNYAPMIYMIFYLIYIWLNWKEFKQTKLYIKSKFY